MLPLNLCLKSLKQVIKESGIFPSYVARRKVAEKYLRGVGLEIGALDHPQPTPPQATVRYVDYISKADSAVKHTQLDPDQIVEVDYIDDGFTLSTIASDSQDFVIANHVLEHSPDPIGALLNWSRVLRVDGILFFSVPMSAKSFDRGRAITTIEHLSEDHEHAISGRQEVFQQRNLEHYDEYLTISLNSIRTEYKTALLTPDEKRVMMQKFCDEPFTDTHYHVFSDESLRSFLSYYTGSVDRSLTLIDCVKSKGGLEYISVLRKNG
jgi:SAM-dependent methyltransferase